MSQPTPEQIPAARWFGGKAGQIAGVEVADRLELGPGAALRVLEVATADGAAERYLWLDGEVGAALVALAAAGAERGRFRFVPGPGAEARGGERPIGHDQSNTSIVVGERLVAKVYRRIEPGVHPEIDLVERLTAAGLDAVPAFRGAGYWDGHPLLLVQDYAADATSGWSFTIAALERRDASFARAVGSVVRRLEDALVGLGAAPAASCRVGGVGRCRPAAAGAGDRAGRRILA